MFVSSAYLSIARDRVTCCRTLAISIITGTGATGTRSVVLHGGIAREHDTTESRVTRIANALCVQLHMQSQATTQRYVITVSADGEIRRHKKKIHVQVWSRPWRPS